MKKYIYISLVLATLLHLSPTKSIENLPPADNTKITLQSKQGDEVTFAYKNIELSQTIKNLIEEVGTQAPISVHAVDTKSLECLKTLLPMVLALNTFKSLYDASNTNTTKESFERQQKEIQDNLNAQDIQSLAELLNAVNYLNVETLFAPISRALATKIQNSTLPVYNTTTSHLTNENLSDEVIKLTMPRVLEANCAKLILGDIVPDKNDTAYITKLTNLVTFFQKTPISEAEVQSLAPSSIAQISSSNGRTINIINTKSKELEKEIPLPDSIPKSTTAYKVLLSPSGKQLLYTGFYKDILYAWIINTENPENTNLLKRTLFSLTKTKIQEENKADLFNKMFQAEADEIFFAFSQSNENFLYALASTKIENEIIPEKSTLHIVNIENPEKVNYINTETMLNDISQFLFNRTGDFILFAKQTSNNIEFQLWDSRDKLEPFILKNWSIPGHLEGDILFSATNDLEFAAKIDENFYKVGIPTLIPFAQKLYCAENKLSIADSFNFIAAGEKDQIELPKTSRKKLTKPLPERSPKHPEKPIKQPKKAKEHTNNIDPEAFKDTLEALNKSLNKLRIIIRN